MKDLTITNSLYVYDSSHGTTIIFEHKNIIYMGNDMVYLLANPIQSEESGNRL